jgi:hypothetical protein
MGIPSPIRLFVTLSATLAAPWLCAQDVALSELLAVNGTGLRDADGDRSDWIEVQNLEAARVTLEGWSLTDDPAHNQRWRFPAVSLDAGAFLVVFASGKNRAAAASELHTSFRLDGDGEYLALLRPDGSVAHEYSLAFPAQREDVSFGIGRSETATALVRAGSACRVLVPASGAAGLDWTLLGFADASWLPAVLGVGYDTEFPDAVPAEETNIARGGTATQSSTLSSFSAPLGNDGSLGNFTHTAAGQNLPATWELDLGRTATISRIVLYNRTSCCGSRLRDITVFVLDAARTQVAFQSELLNPENVLGGGGLSGPAQLALDLVAQTGGVVSGRFVRVVRNPDPDRSGSGGQGNSDEPDVLSLGEVEVFERPVVGFRSLIASDLEAEMFGVRASAYVRASFALAEVPALSVFKLRVLYDAGFVAYLNGAEIARRNAPLAPAWNSAATTERRDEDAVAFEEIPITQHLGALRAGANVLAVHGLNSSASDPDFLILPELVGITVSERAPLHFRSPTPGRANAADGFPGFVADTRFSADRGFYTEPVDVEVTTATEGAEIRCTLDGTAPSLANGLTYEGPLRIASTTVLRAAAFRDGLEPSNVDTQTYVFLEDIVRQDYAATLQAGFPSTWGGTAPDYGMDPDVIGQDGNDRYGGRYAASIRSDLLAVPTISITADVDDLFGPNGIYTNSTQRGDAWERPASVELIHTDASDGFQVDCGLRIQGGAFRSHGLTKKHSLRLLFKGIYGATKLRQAIFGPGAVESFDTLVLRANSNDGWQWDAAGSRPLYVRDSFGRQTVLDMGGVASHEVFAHVYLNGVYWGLYDAVERPDHSFSSSYFGGDKDEWDAINSGQPSSGDLNAWNTLLGLARAGLAANDAYFRLQGRNADGSSNPTIANYLDADNYIDYMITNLYVGNTDWPHKNFWIARRRVASTGFKFYMWDSEWSMGIQSTVSTDQTGVSSGVAEPYAFLRANAEFRLRFADHVQRHFFNGGALYVDPAGPTWDAQHPERNRPAARFVALAAQVDRAVVAESARWGDQHAAVPYTRDEHWAPERLNVLQNYLPQRSRIVLGQFRSIGLYPALDAPTFSQHGGAVAPGFLLDLRAPAGTVYYTLDGSDPRLVGGAVSPEAASAGATVTTTLVPSGANVRVLVPSDGSLGLSWTGLDFDDSSWTPGRTAVGFETASGYEGIIATDIEGQAFNINASVYLRIEFTADDPAAQDVLTLWMQYDDAFVAYLNGQLLAAANAPAAPQWNSTALSSHPDAQAVVFQRFDVSAGLGALRAGRNVLAIHGLNFAATNGDFLIQPELDSGDIRVEGVELRRSTRVRARSLDGSSWSALNEAVFAVDSSRLRITELMYHPPAPPAGSPWGNDQFEFLELQNVGTEPLNLTGYAVDGGITFRFPDTDADPGADLGPGEFVLLVRSLEAFASRYGTAGLRIAGEFEGALDNGGELLVLSDRLGNLVLDFVYSDRWHPLTDGAGYSLEVADAAGPPADWGVAAGWRASTVAGGTPGTGPAPVSGGLQRPGDLNQDGLLDISDAVALLRFLFAGATLPCGDGTLVSESNRALADANADGAADVTDAVRVLAFLFQRGPAPVLGTGCVRLAECAEACR